MKKCFVFLFSWIVLVSTNKSWSELAHKHLAVCSEAGFIPFEMKDDSDHWTGFDIDLVNSFTTKNGYSLTLLNMSLDGLIPALNTRKCDLIASALTITDERAKAVLFSNSVYSVVVSAAFLKNGINENRFKKFEEIDQYGVKVACETGSAATLYIKKVFTKATIQQYTTENDEVNALLQKKADVFIDDNVFISQVEKKLNKQFYILPSKEKGDLAFAARKEDTQLIKKINKFLEDIKKNGEYNAIKDKYF